MLIKTHLFTMYEPLLKNKHNYFFKSSIVFIIALPWVTYEYSKICYDLAYFS